MNSSSTNIIDFHANKPVPAPTNRVATNENEVQLWSALTLGALQKQIEGHENDPKFSDAKKLVDELATNFALANPIDIANYFEAIAAVASLKSPESINRLNSIEAELVEAAA